MNWMSVDDAFERFLRRVPLSVGWVERISIPEQAVLAEAYQAETERLTDALRSGSRKQLEVAIAGLVAA
jgi:hypothetical protein